MRQKNRKINKIFEMKLQKEEIQMANKHKEMLLNSLIFMVCKLKPQ